MATLPDRAAIFGRQRLLRTLLSRFVTLFFLVCLRASCLSAPQTNDPELQQRITAQHAAVEAADAQPIEQTTRLLAAYGLRKMAEVRAIEHFAVQAGELYRRSLALEDSAETHLLLSKLEAQGAIPSKGTSKPVDPAAPLTPAQVSQFSAEERKQYFAAEEQLRKILSSSFDDWGTLKARQQDYSEALVYFHEAEDWDASTPGLARNIGTAAFRLGQYQESSRAFELAVLRDPNDQRSQLMLAMSSFSLDRFAEAARQFTPIQELALKDARAAYAYALSLARSNEQGRANEVLSHLETMALAPDQLSLVCKVYDVTENYEHSAACFRRLSAQDGSYKGAHLEVGAALIRLDRPSEAVPELQAELRIDPTNPDAEYYLAYALLQLSRKDEALPLLQSVIAAHPDYVQAQYQLGKILLEEGHPEQAIEHLAAAAGNDQTHDYLHYQLEVAYRRVGRTEDADRELRLYKQIKSSHRAVKTPGGPPPTSPENAP